MSLAVLSL